MGNLRFRQAAWPLPRKPTLGCRFPYDDWIFHYWTKFVQSVSDTASNRSTSAALTNDGFLTDIIIGIITTIFLAQMQILALPFRWLLGSSYSDSNFMFLVVRQNLSENEDENNEEIECIDQRLIFESEMNIEGSRSSSSKRAVAKLWLLKLPRYIGFEKSLVALAREALHLRIKILEINGMSDSIQMRPTTFPFHLLFEPGQSKSVQLISTILNKFKTLSSTSQGKLSQAAERFLENQLKTSTQEKQIELVLHLKASHGDWPRLENQEPPETRQAFHPGLDVDRRCRVDQLHHPGRADHDAQETLLHRTSSLSLTQLSLYNLTPSLFPFVTHQGI